MTKSLLVLLSAVATDDPPSEFRIFKGGWNDSEKGKFLFDKKAADDVMRKASAHGVRRMIDLEHLSLDSKAPNYDPDPRGWFDLELRDDGSLWAVSLDWLADGVRRLKGKLQPYISPAFLLNKGSRRVEQLFNVAICAVPAMHDLEQLVAASLHSGRKLGTLSIGANKMDALKKILSALGLGEDATLEDALASIKALQEDEGGEGEGDGSETLKKLRAALKLADDASEDDCMKALAALSDDADGDEGPKEEKLTAALKGEIVALRQNVKTMSATVAELQGDHQKSKKEKLIEDNVEKLSVETEKWARASDTSIETLTAFFKVAQPVHARPAKDKPQGGETSIETLSDAQKDVIASSGLSEEQILKFQKKNAAARAEKLKRQQAS